MVKGRWVPLANKGKTMQPFESWKQAKEWFLENRAPQIAGRFVVLVIPSRVHSFISGCKFRCDRWEMQPVYTAIPGGPPGGTVTSLIS